MFTRVLKFLFLPAWLAICFAAYGLLAPAATSAQNFQFEALKNGDFRTDGDFDGIPDNWKLRNRSGDGLDCACGLCAFTIAGNSSLIKQLTQTATYDGYPGDTLYLTASSRAKDWSGVATIGLTVFFQDGSKSVTWFDLSTGADYFTFEGYQYMLKRYDKVKVSVRTRGLTGRLWIDKVSLKYY